MFHEWELPNGLVVTLTTTDEGFVLDVFNMTKEESILTEAMTIDEWVHWMNERQKERMKNV